MSDDDIIADARIFSSENHYEGGRAVRFEFSRDRILMFARAIEQASRRSALEEAKQLCLAREARVGPTGKGDDEWFIGFSEGIKPGAHHCACEIDDAIHPRALANGGE